MSHGTVTCLHLQPQTFATVPCTQTVEALIDTDGDRILRHNGGLYWPIIPITRCWGQAPQRHIATTPCERA